MKIESVLSKSDTLNTFTFSAQIVNKRRKSQENLYLLLIKYIKNRFCFRILICLDQAAILNYTKL